MNDYGKILYELKMIKAELRSIDIASKTIKGWLPRKYVMRFFDVGDTTMAKYEKQESIVMSKIGNKKVYKVDSIVNFIESNIRK